MRNVDISISRKLPSACITKKSFDCPLVSPSFIEFILQDKSSTSGVFVFERDQGRNTVLSGVQGNSES